MNTKAITLEASDGTVLDVKTRKAQQLVPELLDVAGLYDRFIFVNAHVRKNRSDIALEPVIAGRGIAPFTHHMTPDMFLFLIKEFYNHQPEAFLLTIRGEDFGFVHGFSPVVHERVKSWFPFSISRKLP